MKKFLHDNIFLKLFFKFFRIYLSDLTYSKFILFRQFGRNDILNPQTFNEKIHWLKNFYEPNFYSELADKYKVRNYVSQKIGQNYLNDLYGVYDRFSDILWDSLPEKFIIKANHGSGMNMIVENKNGVNLRNLNKLVERWLKTDYSKKGREGIYKKIPRKIIIEKLLKDKSGKIPYDYKVFCFNGCPAYIQVDIDRFGSHTRAFYDIYWNRQEFSILHPIYRGPEIDKPNNLDSLLTKCRILSEGIPFVRIDFYLLPNLIFGEMTFYPGNGNEKFYPDEWDFIFGNKLKLPRKNVDEFNL